MWKAFCNWLICAIFAGAAFVWAAADPGAEIAAAIRARDYQHALDLVRPELERAPKDVRILTLEAIALAGLGRDGEALAAYGAALRIAPNSLAALEGAAELEYKAGSDRAIALLDRVLDQQPANPTAHAMRAVMAWKHRDCATAARHFGLAGEAISTQPAALEQYAACLVRLERPADAVPVLRQLTALDPADRRARYRLAAAQFLTKAYADSLETLGPLVEGTGADAESLDLASSAWEATGDTPRAVAALRQAIVLDPANTRLYVDFASLSVAHNSCEVGVDVLNVGLRRVPASAELYVARGVLYVQLGKYDEADADFAAAERLDPRQGAGSLARGLFEIQQSDFDKALATVRQQLKTQPKNEFLYYLLAEILTSQGAQPGDARFQEAQAAASRAVELKPDFALARDVLSRLYLASGQVDRAIEQCRLALRDNPMDATALYRLIRALQKSHHPGAPEEIKSLLERFKQVRGQLARQEAEETRYKLVEEARGGEKP